MELIRQWSGLASLLVLLLWVAPSVEHTRVQYWLLADRIRHLERRLEPAEVPVPDSVWRQDAMESDARECMGSATIGGRHREYHERPWIVRETARLSAGTNLNDLLPYTYDEVVIYDIGSTLRARPASFAADDWRGPAPGAGL